MRGGGGLFFNEKKTAKQNHAFLGKQRFYNTFTALWLRFDLKQ